MTTLENSAMPSAMPSSALLVPTVDLSVRLLHLGVLISDVLKTGHGLQAHPCPVGTLYYHATQQEAPE